MQIADLELNVELYRQKLAMLYDFEPFAAFKRLDTDDDGYIYTMDFYNFMSSRDNVNSNVQSSSRWTVKDCQLMMQFYDLDASGMLSYSEFMKFILPCDKPELREEACLRKTYKADLKAGQQLHQSVETAIYEFFDRELTLHTKIEMMKHALRKCPDWDAKAAFNIIDS